MHAKHRASRLTGRALQKTTLPTAAAAPQVSFMAPFSFDGGRNSLALVEDGAMLISTIDDIQRLHIKTVPLGESPLGLTHHPPGKCYVLLTEARTHSPGALLSFFFLL
jgi:hypothetical protein